MYKFIKPYTNFLRLFIQHKHVLFAYALLPFAKKPLKSNYKYIKTLKDTFHLFKNDGELLQKLIQCNYINIEGLICKKPYVTIHYNNQNIQIHAINYDNIKVIEEVFINFLYDFRTIEHVVVCDVGMNVGVASLFFASFENVKKVYGFEPFLGTFKLAEENFKLNSTIASKITYYNYGLGKSDSTLSVPLPNSGFLGGTTSDFFYPHLPKNRKSENTTVEIKEISKIIQQIKTEHPSQKILLKLDCEGAEYEIVDNLCDTGLINEVSYIFAEYHFKGKEALMQRLTQKGFFVLGAANEHISPFGMIYAFKK